MNPKTTVYVYHPLKRKWHQTEWAQLLFSALVIVGFGFLFYAYLIAFSDALVETAAGAPDAPQMRTTQ
jgi:hypothetical protein